ncbi:DUF6735 family protein [Halorarius litoreus]|uniref:DUF6735 family protein n=1 Tax=Halorarius litoreus TaxID=2962676 RepID=UPI0020CCFE43|nr:DUF6735 family protein [Halorarius litoreus]
MADRTLVAYEREHGYDTHYAHDGVDPERLGPETPTGGDADRDLTRLRDLLAERGITLGADRGGTAVDPDPLATGLSWPDVVAGLDYRAYDRCLRVSHDWDASAFLVCWFGFEARGGDPCDPVGDGALLAVAERDEPFARGWFEGVKSTVADGLRCGLYGEDAARGYLGGRVRAFAAEREVFVA